LGEFAHKRTRENAEIDERADDFAERKVLFLKIYINSLNEWKKEENQ
jgi:hypothetical protein